MSKTISYKGKLNQGTQDRIRLRTINGKIGYKITKFEVISATPGADSGDHNEFVVKIFTKDQTGSISPTVDFTDSELLAVVYYEDHVSPGSGGKDTIIFDNKVTNQDIFVTSQDAGGGTVPANYYIELERMTLTDVESTMMTLKSIRTVTSR